jgi:hypothetical protein
VGLFTVGRPLTPIDAEQVFKLGPLGLTQAEIADVFNVSPSVISERFRTEITRARAHWKMSLRRAQWKRAKAGSDAMLIHLGKSEFGQTYKVDVTTTGKPTVVYVEHADNPRDDELDGWALQRARALTERSPAAGTVLRLEDSQFGEGGGDPCNGMRQPATN